MQIDPDPSADAPAAPPESPPAAEAVRTSMRTVNHLLAAIVVMLAVAGLWLGQAVLIPVAGGLLLTMLCKPIVQRIVSLGVWRHAAAGLVLGALAAAIFVAIALLVSPAVEWMDNAPQHLQRIEQRVRELHQPMKKLTDAGEQIDRITGGDEFVQKVEVATEGYPLVDRSLRFIGSFAIVLVLCYFLLVYWDDFLLNLIRSIPRFTHRKEAVAAVREAERDVSHFLVVVTTINATLGLLLWPVFYFVGLPNPALWAAVCGLLNFIPYLGALTSLVLIFLVSLIAFEPWSAVLLPPLVFVTITALEGYLITPLILGRGLRLNPVVVLLALLFWGWLWGVVGALMSVPLVVLARAICAHIEPLHPIARLMGAAGSDENLTPAPDTPPPTPAPA